MAASLFGLKVSEPAILAIALQSRLGPEQQDVHATVGASGDRVAGKWRTHRSTGMPGFDPGNHLLLQGLDDPVGHLLVDITHAVFLGEGMPMPDREWVPGG